PFILPHLLWHCTVNSLDPSHLSCIHTLALFDYGSPAVLINASLVAKLHLKKCPLPNPFPVSTVIFESTVNVPCPDDQICLTEWVKLKLHDQNNVYSTHTVQALVAPSLCHLIILGLPFMHHNDITVNIQNGSALDNYALFDLLHPTPPTLPVPKLKLKETIAINVENHKCLMDELHTVCTHIRPLIKELASIKILNTLDGKFKAKYADCFPMDIPHATELPSDVYHHIKIKPGSPILVGQAYSCPQKYRDGWKMLIEQHSKAEWIRLSSLPYASPSFIIPKPDPTVLP
ncbi:hypothetical protein L208DRAFT_1302578, partial [Tricholoma matsutake]